MAAPSKETLEQIAAETGHQPGTLEKVLRLLDLLQDIADDPLLGDKLALKGGTALNVFHLQLDRLSVDIDLNYVGALDRETMMEERPRIEEALQRILKQQGYQVRLIPEGHAGGKWIARHASALGGQGNIEIDLNYMFRQPLFGASRLNSITLGGRQAKDVLVIDLHEIVAGKLVALLDRRAARDLFDANRIFAINDLDWRKILAAMLAIGATSRNDFRKASADKIGADLKELRAKLAICLPRSTFAAKGSSEAWVAETLAHVKERMTPLLAFSDEERLFLDEVNAKGHIRTELLDVGSGLQKRIAEMPMLQWKCAHVREHKGRS
ncbi:MAG: nucleotidyl transferase AbiEii/AbiGii toxin family protein [Alphaproteobacteria bacterium]|nr:nucleotidyl transferase AbiEii/AbiGii toxin family protein [Alphaproteobacteria bacterium]